MSFEDHNHEPIQSEAVQLKKLRQVRELLEIVHKLAKYDLNSFNPLSLDPNKELLSINDNYTGTSDSRISEKVYIRFSEKTPSLVIKRSVHKRDGFGDSEDTDIAVMESTSDLSSSFINSSFQDEVLASEDLLGVEITEDDRIKIFLNGKSEVTTSDSPPDETLTPQDPRFKQMVEAIKLGLLSKLYFYLVFFREHNIETQLPPNIFQGDDENSRERKERSINGILKEITNFILYGLFWGLKSDQFECNSEGERRIGRIKINNKTFNDELVPVEGTEYMLCLHTKNINIEYNPYTKTLRIEFADVTTPLINTQKLSYDESGVIVTELNTLGEPKVREEELDRLGETGQKWNFLVQLSGYEFSGITTYFDYSKQRYDDIEGAYLTTHCNGSYEQGDQIPSEILAFLLQRFISFEKSETEE